MSRPAASMTRVGMATHSYYLRDPRVRREAEALAASGHEVDVVSLRRPGEAWRERVGGVTIYRIPLGHRRAGKFRYLFEYTASLFLAGIWLSVLSLGRRYRVVQVHTPPDLLVFAALVPRLLGARVLLDLHDPMPETMATIFGTASSPWLVRLVRLQERLATAFAHHVVTVTEQVREAVIARGVHPDGIGIVMNFADDRLFDPDLRHSDHPPPDGRIVIVFMGTLSYRYGVDLAIQAIDVVRRTHPSALLRVIGDGEARPQLEALVRTLGLEANVELVGQVPIDRIPRVALPASVAVAPHRRDVLYDMCFPSKIYDYLSLGLPVVAAWTESLDYYYGKDTLAFFESGDSAALAEQILGLVRDPGRVAKMRRHAVAFLAAHGWVTERERYLMIVAALVRRARVLTADGAGREKRVGG